MHSTREILCVACPGGPFEYQDVMCNRGEEETIDHLFFDCPFAKECWAIIHFDWNDTLQLSDRLVQAGQVHNVPFFTEAALIAA